ncbi:MAG: glycosyltransferase [Lachnospiraceae bacterium]|nr:glycosyltransferase [Lachnospiraceae bacterium]
MKKTIVFYISSLRKGGAERVIVNLAEHFHKSGYRVVIVTTRIAEREYEISEGIIRRISEPKEEMLQSGRVGNFKTRFTTLRDIWKEEKPDLIVSFIGKNNMMAILTSVFLKIPVVVSVRGNPPSEYYTKGLKLAEEVLFKKAAGVVLQTRESVSFFPKAVQKKSVILPNPLNPVFIKPAFEGKRKNQIVSVGILDENKNQAMLVRAFAQIIEEFPEMELVLYGEGEKRIELEALAKELKITEKVLMPGQCDKVQDTIDKARIFVLTSDTEGSPNAVIEAMSLGLAVVSTDCPCGGPAELIQNGENGLLVPVGNEKALAEALRKILSSPELEEKLRRNAVQIQTTMEPEVVCKKWQQYLEEVMR